MHLAVYGSEENLVTASKSTHGFELGIKHQPFLQMLVNKDTNIQMSTYCIILRQGYVLPFDLP